MKFLKLFLLFALILFALLPAEIYAADESKDITISYRDLLPTSTVYSVDVIWGALKFDYNGGSIGTWDIDTHQYTGYVAPAWTHQLGAENIIITNHSNAPIDVAFSYTRASAYNAIAAEFTGIGITNSKIVLATAEGTELAAAPSVTASLGISGTMTGDDILTEVTVGTATVTISPIS